MKKSSLKEILSDKKEIDQSEDHELKEMIEKIANKKIDAVATFIKFSIPAQIDALKHKIERLKSLDKNLTDYVSSQIREHGKLVGDGFRMRLQRNPARLIVEDQSAVPDNYKTTQTKIETTILVKELKKDLEAGKEVPGCRLEYGDHVRIEEGD